jgi:hypothetical protein
MYCESLLHNMAIRLNTSSNIHQIYAVLIVWLVGCGGCGNRDLVDVRGIIMLDSTPLLGGVITFEPVDGNGATAGGKIEEGKYELTGSAAVPPGAKVVRIMGAYKTGRQIEVGPPAPPGTMTDEVEHIAIPAIYNQNSTLQCEVVAGKMNQHDFELHSR